MRKESNRTPNTRTHTHRHTPNDHNCSITLTKMSLSDTYCIIEDLLFSVTPLAIESQLDGGVWSSFVPNRVGLADRVGVTQRTP